jgi:hypothetical protein
VAGQRTYIIGNEVDVEVVISVQNGEMFLVLVAYIVLGKNLQQPNQFM